MVGRPFSMFGSILSALAATVHLFTATSLWSALGDEQLRPKYLAGAADDVPRHMLLCCGKKAAAEEEPPPPAPDVEPAVRSDAPPAIQAAPAPAKVPEPAPKEVDEDLVSAKSIRLQERKDSMLERAEPNDTSGKSIKDSPPSKRNRPNPSLLNPQGAGGETLATLSLISEEIVKSCESLPD